MAKKPVEQKEELIIETDDDELELEIEDDTPDDDKDRKPPEGYSPEDGDDDDDDDEAKEYSERVQKRIKKLTYEKNEERREKEAALRMREEAVRAAQTAHEEMQRLRGQMTEGRGLLQKEAEGRIEAQLAAAQRSLRDAHDEGDSEKIVEAQSKLADLYSEKSRLASMVQEISREKTAPKPQQPQPQRRQPTRMAQEWAERNTWFNKDPKLTAYAFGVHDDLIRNKGVQPDTEEYYRQIDAEMRKTFPSEFGQNQEPHQKPATVVAPPSRLAGKSPRKVRLSKTQVALAKRLGITPEQYAEQLLKQGKSDG